MIRLRASSICHADVIFAEGGWGSDLSAVYGHEGAGVIEAVSMVRPCETCTCCRDGLRGFDQECDVKFIDHAGQPIHQGLKTAAFAEYATVHRS